MEGKDDGFTSSTLTRRGVDEEDDDNNDKGLIQEKDDHEPFYKRKSHWIFHAISILKFSKTNLLLIFFIPAVVMSMLHADETLTFFFNFLAIIPLSKMLTIGVDDLSARLGPAYGAVFHAFSGNFVELVIESFALVDGHYAIVRSVVLGSILCNITLVLGIAFIAGSWPTKRRRREGSMYSLNASFEVKLFVNTSASILALAVLALVTPAAFKIAIASSDPTVSPFIECNIQNISHATAIILALIYAGLLVFQLKTHSKEVVDATEFDSEIRYNLFLDLVLVVASIAGITICARILVSSIEHVAENFELGTGFVGVVLIPLCVVSNFMEHYQAIHDAVHDKVDTAISLILNTSVQMALLVAPILVLVGWILNKPLTLDFNILEISVLGCAVLIVNYLVADSKANWLEGYMLITSYCLIAIAFFYFPNVPEPDKSFHCDPFSRNLLPKNVTDQGGEGGGHR